MADSAFRDRYVELLLEKVHQDRYPSITQLDLIESLLPAESMDAYLAILFEKIEEVDYPSVPMMQRIQRLTAQLPAAG